MRTKRAIKALKTLSDYYSKIIKDLERCNFEKNKSIIMLDWDILRQPTVDINLPKGLFASSILAGVSFAKNSDLKLCVPDGAKLEVYKYLLGRRRHYFNLRKINLYDIKKEENEFKSSFKGVYKNSNWRTNEKHSKILSKYDQKLEKLHYLFKNNTIPYEKVLSECISNESIQIKSTAEFKYALELLNERRPGAAFRNDADARNIAISELLRKRGYNVNLLTGTKILHEIKPDLTIDALCFLLTAYYYSVYRNKDLYSLNESLIYINSYLGRLLVSAKHVEKTISTAKQKRYQKTKFEIDKFQNELADCLDDSVVNNVKEILSTAGTQAKNRYLMMKDKDNAAKKFYLKTIQDDSYDLSYLQKLETMIKDFSSASFYNFKEIGYKLEEKKPKNYTVIDSRNVKAISFTVSNPFLYISFPTSFAHDSVINFLKTTSKKSDSGLSSINVGIQSDTKFTINKNFDAVIENGIGRYISNDIASSIRFSTKDYQILYSHNDSKIKEKPSITFLLPRKKENPNSIEIAIRLINGFSQHYFPDTLLRNEIENYLKI